MPLAPLGDLISSARGRNVGLVAFNVILLEQAEAIVAAAEDCGLPTVLQISETTVAYHHGRIDPIGRACESLASSASVPIALHLDHATSFKLCRKAADVGFGSVMFDASALPYRENVSATAEVARWGRENGIHVEAELGEIGGKDGGDRFDIRTDPREARDFVASTAIDSLAVAVGTRHARLEQTAALDLNLVTQLRDAVPVPLVLHGASGVLDATLRDAVRSGISKVNIATRLNQALTGRVRTIFDAEPGLVDPRKYLGSARIDVSAVVSRLLPLLET
jgi:fructose-bisphosphate aldolase, class II